MTRYLTLLGFVLAVFLGSLHARRLEQEEISDIVVDSHHVAVRATSCPAGQCLSQYNYCGTTDAHCGIGCKAGPCRPGVNPCASGQCLSAYNFCGTGNTYCGAGCKAGPCFPSGVPPPPSVSTIHSGDGTYYFTGLGACGVRNSNTELICAMAHADFDPYTPNGNPNKNTLCGRYIAVRGPKGSVTVKVVDRCGGCKSGDLDLSPTAFDQIADRSAGRVRINWRFL